MTTILQHLFPFFFIILFFVNPSHPKKLETFSNLFRLYEKDAELDSQEPNPLIPLNSNTNLFKTPFKVTSLRSISECARNNGTLLALSNSNRNK